MSNKISLGWIPQLFENYKKDIIRQQKENIQINRMDHELILIGKYSAADELLLTIKEFIKEANNLTES